MAAEGHTPVLWVGMVDTQLEVLVELVLLLYALETIQVVSLVDRVLVVLILEVVHVQQQALVVLELVVSSAATLALVEVEVTMAVAAPLVVVVAVARLSCHPVDHQPTMSTLEMVMEPSHIFPLRPPLRRL